MRVCADLLPSAVLIAVVCLPALAAKPSATELATARRWARYTLVNLDDPTPAEATGAELMDEGLLVEAREKPLALVFRYWKK